MSAPGPGEPASPAGRPASALPAITYLSVSCDMFDPMNSLPFFPGASVCLAELDFQVCAGEGVRVNARDGRTRATGNSAFLPPLSRLRRQPPRQDR